MFKIPSKEDASNTYRHRQIIFYPDFYYYGSKYVYKPLLYRFSKKEKIQDVLDLCNINMIVNYNGIKIKTSDVIIYDTKDNVFDLYDSICEREKEKTSIGLFEHLNDIYVSFINDDGNLELDDLVYKVRYSGTNLIHEPFRKYVVTIVGKHIRTYYYDPIEGNASTIINANPSFERTKENIDKIFNACDDRGKQQILENLSMSLLKRNNVYDLDVYGKSLEVYNELLGKL